jgi:hypothetical protein
VASQPIVPGEPSGKSITQQHAVPPLERLRRHQPAEQRVRLGYHPHLTRQDRTQLLQSVAFTPGTGEIQVKIKKPAGAIAATAAVFGLGAVPIAWDTSDFR